MHLQRKEVKWKTLNPSFEKKRKKKRHSVKTTIYSSYAVEKLEFQMERSKQKEFYVFFYIYILNFNLG